MGGCTGNGLGLGLPGSCGCSASPAGMCAGLCGSSIRTSTGWSGSSCCSSAGTSAGGLGSWGSSASTCEVDLEGDVGNLLLNLLSLSLLL